MGTRVFHPPLAIRVYEWVEMSCRATPCSVAPNLQSVYMSGLKYAFIHIILSGQAAPLQSVYMSGLKYGHNNVIPTRGACNPCM